MSMCIYHGNCADGFGAAWVVRKALGEIDFHPGKYQEPPPDVTGKDVVMVDFSYKRPVLLEMAEKANSILILDHHKTAAEDLLDHFQQHRALIAEIHHHHVLARHVWRRLLVLAGVKVNLAERLANNPRGSKAIGTIAVVNAHAHVFFPFFVVTV